MLKIYDDGNIKSSGAKYKKLADLTYYMHEGLQHGWFTLDELYKCVNNAAKSDREIEQQALNAMNDFLSHVLKGFDNAES